jgi:CheY-like chemotaxis protein
VSFNIVVIDDDDDDIFILSEALRNLDSEVAIQAFTDSEHACTQLFSGKVDDPDYIFMYINMPKIMGHQCLEMIRGYRDFDKTTIVMISTTMSSRDAIKHVSNGADFAVQKPIKSDEYKELLLKIFSHRRAHS